MKALKLILPILLLAAVSCKKDRDFTNPICKEKPPKGQMCQAYFQRWFYNPETNDCYQYSYSGCERAGFATEKECEQCECNLRPEVEVPFKE